LNNHIELPVDNRAVLAFAITNGFNTISVGAAPIFPLAIEIDHLFYLFEFRDPFK